MGVVMSLAIINGAAVSPFESFSSWGLQRVVQKRDAAILQPNLEKRRVFQIKAASAAAFCGMAVVTAVEIVARAAFALITLLPCLVVGLTNDRCNVFWADKIVFGILQGAKNLRHFSSLFSAPEYKPPAPVVQQLAAPSVHEALTVDDLLSGIFSHLKLPDLVSCRQVCKAWRRVTRDCEEVIWRGIYKNTFPNAPLPVGSALEAYRRRITWTRGLCTSPLPMHRITIPKEEQYLGLTPDGELLSWKRGTKQLCTRDIITGELREDVSTGDAPPNDRLEEIPTEISWNAEWQALPYKVEKEKKTLWLYGREAYIAHTALEEAGFKRYGHSRDEGRWIVAWNSSLKEMGLYRVCDKQIFRLPIDRSALKYLHFTKEEKLVTCTKTGPITVWNIAQERCETVFTPPDETGSVDVQGGILYRRTPENPISYRLDIVDLTTGKTLRSFDTRQGGFIERSLQIHEKRLLGEYGVAMESNVFHTTGTFLYDPLSHDQALSIPVGHYQKALAHEGVFLLNQSGCAISINYKPGNLVIDDVKPQSSISVLEAETGKQISSLYTDHLIRDAVIHRGRIIAHSYDRVVTSYAPPVIENCDTQISIWDFSHLPTRPAPLSLPKNGWKQHLKSVWERVFPTPAPYLPNFLT